MSLENPADQSGKDRNAGDERSVGTRQSSSTTHLEMTRIILEFLSKCFYPAIVVAVLYALWPAFSGIDLKSLMGRLQSAKAGDYEFTFGQAQDVGAEIAPLNSKIAELERLLTVAQAEILELQDVTKVAKPTAQETKELQEKERRLKANSEYTLLVFHRTTSKDKAATVTRALLDKGFQSSATETNFSELQKITPEENVVFVTYTSKGEEVLPEVEREIARVAPGAEVKRNPRPISLRRGDVQILVF